MTRRRLWRLIADLVCDWLLIVLSVDLLYLYALGAWSDSRLYILCLELACLPTTAIVGVFRFYIHIKEVKDEY